jgi:hypothetical protein
MSRDSIRHRAASTQDRRVPSKRTFSFVFTMALAGVFLIVTGLIGYQPPAHLSLDGATWRRGTWTDHVVVSQVVLGADTLLAAGIVAVRAGVWSAPSDRPYDEP